jgi:hypothetical protein
LQAKKVFHDRTLALLRRDTRFFCQALMEALSIALHCMVNLTCRPSLLQAEVKSLTMPSIESAARELSIEIDALKL